MRICIVSQEYPPETGGGGIGTQSRLKAQGLSARGHHVEVVSASWTQPRTEWDGPVAVHRIAPTDFGVHVTDESMRWLTYSLAVAKRLQEMEVEDHFDILQFPEYVGEGFCYQTNNFQYRHARYAVQLHGPLGMFAEHLGWPPRDSAAFSLGSFMEKSVIHFSDGVMASSHHTARFCAQYYDHPLDQIAVVHSGVDIETFAPRDRDPGLPFPRILFVGNLVEAKGFDSLVDVVCRLRPRYPDIALRTIGKGTEKAVREARRRAADAGAGKQIEFLGYVPPAELPAHFGWCDMFAGPSAHEPGPGNVYLEAMACGRPVIAGNTAGTPEVIDHERSGLLIRPGDLDDLEGAIVRLTEQPAFRTSLAQAGRQFVVEEMAVDKYLDKVEQFYERLLRQPHRLPGDAPFIGARE